MWWNWPKEIVKKAVPIIQQGDIEGLESFAHANHVI